MPLLKTITTSGGLIGVWHLTEPSTELLPSFLPKELSDPAFQQLSNEKRKVEWLAIRLLLKQLTGPDFSISYTSSGRPLLNHSKYKHLSISHSRDFAVIFLHENHPVGIDIEQMNRNFSALEKRYLSTEEFIFVNHRPELQCLFWCAKEAIFKLVPDEGIEFREQILISPFSPELENSFRARFISGKHTTEHLLGFTIFLDHCMVWVKD
jgi:phosphopantetheinyl transferase